jgi:hypothetical protein
MQNQGLGSGGAALPFQPLNLRAMLFTFRCIIPYPSKLIFH